MVSACVRWSLLAWWWPLVILIFTPSRNTVVSFLISVSRASQLESMSLSALTTVWQYLQAQFVMSPRVLWHCHWTGQFLYKYLCFCSRLFIVHMLVLQERLRKQQASRVPYQAKPNGSSCVQLLIPFWISIVSISSSIFILNEESPILLLSDSEKGLKIYHRQNSLCLSYIVKPTWLFQSFRLNAKWEETLSTGRGTLF